MKYYDSSVLISLYLHEALTKKVASYVQSTILPIPFHALHELEILTGMRQKVFRKESEVSSVEMSIQAIQDDLERGILYRPTLDWSKVFHHAHQLSAKLGLHFQARSLDLLQIACALELKASSFITSDKRQSQLARKAGLEVILMQ